MKNPLLLTIISIIFSLSVILTFLVYSTHVDVAWYLHAADIWLDGGTLFKDVVDMNPPGIIFLSTPAAYLASVLHSSSAFLFYIQTYILAALLYFYTYRNLKVPAPARPVILITLALLLFVTPGYEFGQREYYVFILVLPYLLQHLSHISHEEVPRTHLLLSGTLLGLAIIIKPHYVLLPTLLELLLWVNYRQKLFRLDLILALALNIIHIIVICLLFPEYFEIVAIALLSYGSYHQVVPTDIVVPLLIAFIAVILVSLKKVISKGIKPTTMLFFATGTIFLIIGIVQNKGWFNHFYPASVTFILTIVIVLTDLIIQYSKSPRRSLVFFTSSLCILITLFLYSALSIEKSLRLSDYYQNDPGFNQTVEFINTNGANEMISLYSLNMNPHYLLIHNSNKTTGSRFNAFWMLPETVIQRSATENEVKQIESFALDAAINDLKKNKPGLLLFDNAKNAKINNRSFDFVSFFSKRDEFREILKKDYQQIDFNDGSFTAYERVP